MHFLSKETEELIKKHARLSACTFGVLMTYVLLLCAQGVVVATVNQPAAAASASGVAQPVRIIPTWKLCANEGAKCAFSGTREVRYGAGTTFVTKIFSNGTPCTNEVFGDPIVGTVKRCEVGALVSAESAVPSVTPKVEVPTPVQVASGTVPAIPPVVVAQKPVVDTPAIAPVVKPSPVTLPLVPSTTTKSVIVPLPVPPKVEVPKPVVLPKPAVASAVHMLKATSTTKKGPECELIRATYQDTKKQATVTWKTRGATKVNINGLEGTTTPNTEITTTFAYSNKKDAVFELQAVNDVASVACRLVLPALKSCSIAVQNDPLDEKYALYTATFPTVLGAPYQAIVYDSRGYYTSVYSSGQIATSSSMTYSGKILKTRIDKGKVQLGTRVALSRNYIGSNLDNAYCYTKYDSSK